MVHLVLLALLAVFSASANAVTPVFNASVNGLGLTIYDDDSYDVWTLNASAPWLSSAFTAGVRAGGQWYSYPAVPAALGATRLGGGPASGAHPRLGAWTGYRLNYTTPRGGVFVNTFQLFLAPPPLPGGEWRGTSPLLVFEQSFPAGLQGVNGSAPGGAADGFAKSPSPATAFPAFKDAQTATTRAINWWTWADTFFSGAFGGHMPVSTGLAAVKGSEGGPLVLAAYWGEPQEALVLAPFSNLKSTILGQSSIPDPPSFGPVAACGVSTFVAALPPGHTAACAIGYAPGGPNAAMHAWGATMQVAYGTSRIADPAAQALTYWTDNGAYCE